MRRLSWTGTIRVLSLLTAAFFVAAAVLQLEVVFGLVTGQPPPPLDDFLDDTVAFWQWENGRWPMEFAAAALFTVGFMTLAGVGVLLAKLGDQADARRPLVASAFLGTGGLGAASQLIIIAVKPFATQPHLCDCNFRAEEIWSRMVVLDATYETQIWLVIGAIVVAAAGFVLVAGLGRDRGLPAAWAWLSYLITAVGLATAVLGALNLWPFNQLAIFAVAGLLVPIWAVWLAVRAPTLAGPDELPPA